MACAGWRPDTICLGDPVVATRIALKSLAGRILELNDEIGALHVLIAALIREINSRLLDRCGIGIDIAGQLLVTGGDNPARMRSEAGFAMLCGVAPPTSLLRPDDASPPQPRR